MKINDFLDEIRNIIEKYYPHLRHSRRGEIEIDDFLRDKIKNVIENG